MHKLISYLEELGLNHSEARVYIAGIGYARPAGVHELQKQCELKRPTVYHNLNLLEERGLVSKVRSQNRTLYTFSSPNQLEWLVQQEIRNSKAKLRSVASFIREFDEVSPLQTATSVRHFEGAEGVKQAIESALYCKNPEWLVIAPFNNFFRQFDKNFSRYYLVTRKRHEIRSRTLWEKPDPGGRKLTKEEVSERQPRYLPNVMQGKFTATIIIFDEKVAIIQSINELSAILIESKDISDTYRAMFEGLWGASRPYEAVISSKGQA
jgi:sugar-specific transcriptional regulator TrmB